MSKTSQESQIVIYGGGMAGALLAKALSPEFRITLVDPNDYFEVPMSVPRSLVQPDFAEGAIMPFASILPQVRHLRGMLTELQADAGLVALADGSQQRLRSRITVLATGSTFSNPLMRAIGGSSVRERKEFYARFEQRIVKARNILIVGGGPIGVEVAGEISENHPAKAITIVEAGPRLLASTSEAAAQYAAQVLQRRGVTILTGERIERAGSTSDIVFAEGGEATTLRGRRIAYDLLIWCIGGKPNTGYMKPHFAPVLDAAGRIRVKPDLRVAGFDRLFALGDITDLDENKMAWHIDGQVSTATRNIRALLTDTRRPLQTYRPQTGNPKMAVTLGSRDGVIHLPVIGMVHLPLLSRMAKAGHMLVPKYRRALGAPQ